MVQVDETLAMLEALAIEAGQIILRIRANGAGARLKHDGSPVTDADQAAESTLPPAFGELSPAHQSLRKNAPATVVFQVFRPIASFLSIPSTVRRSSSRAGRTSR